jgi:hypothetical protein
MAHQPQMPPHIQAYIPSPHHTQPANQTSYDRGGNRRNAGRGRRNQRGGRSSAPPPNTTAGNQPPYVWPHPATKQSDDNHIWPTSTNTILQHNQTFCQLELLLYLWVRRRRMAHGRHMPTPQTRPSTTMQSPQLPRIQGCRTSPVRESTAQTESAAKHLTGRGDTY